MEWKYSVAAGLAFFVAVEQGLAHAMDPYQPVVKVPTAAISVIASTTASSDTLTIANTMGGAVIRIPPMPSHATEQR
jgi:hypothetical protein